MTTKWLRSMSFGRSRRIRIGCLLVYSQEFQIFSYYRILLTTNSSDKLLNPSDKELPFFFLVVPARSLLLIDNEKAFNML